MVSPLYQKTIPDFSKKVIELVTLCYRRSIGVAHLSNHTHMRHSCLSNRAHI